MKSDTVLLFLDFDGVLHPYAPWPHDQAVRAGYFQHLPRLEAVLRDFSGVRVVVSSDWRRHYTLEALRQFFSEDIRDRVVGTTAPEPTNGDAVGQRQRQAEEYLRDHDLVGVPWIAIDDTPNNYLPDARLVLCSDMFGAAQGTVLRDLLMCLTSDSRDRLHAIERFTADATAAEDEVEE